eukprot:SM000007S20844  [mRNA]  locus=s7:573843:577519:+ [translate_table: standard]
MSAFRRVAESASPAVAPGDWPGGPPSHPSEWDSQKHRRAGAPASKAAVQPVHACKTMDLPDTEERFSGLRIRRASDRLVPAAALEEEMSRFRYVPLHALKHIAHDRKECLRWATVGVLATKSKVRATASGSVYLECRLSLLGSDRMSLFLHGNACKHHLNQREGSIVAVFSAKLLPLKKDCDIAMSISRADQLLAIGLSMDFGFCKGKTKAGTPCTKVLDRQAWLYPTQRSIFHKSERQADYCESHVQVCVLCRPAIGCAGTGAIGAMDMSSSEDTDARIHYRIPQTAYRKVQTTRLEIGGGNLSSAFFRTSKKMKHDRQRTHTRHRPAKAELLASAEDIQRLLKGPENLTSRSISQGRRFLHALSAPDRAADGSEASSRAGQVNEPLAGGKQSMRHVASNNAEASFKRWRCNKTVPRQSLSASQARSHATARQKQESSTELILRMRRRRTAGASGLSLESNPCGVQELKLPECQPELTAAGLLELDEEDSNALEEADIKEACFSTVVFADQCTLPVSKEDESKGADFRRNHHVNHKTSTHRDVTHGDSGWLCKEVRATEAL